MARGRMLNNKVSASKQFDSLPNDTCRLLATWLIAHLDVRGVFYGDPALVKSYVFPRRTDVSLLDVASYLEAMAEAKDGDGVPMIVLFEARGETWMHWPKFAANQVGLRADRETSDFPLPPGFVPQDDERDAGELPETGGTDAGELPAEEKVSEVKLSKGKVKENSKESSGADAPPISADYQEIRRVWQELFPAKPLPRANNRKIAGKFATRMNDAHFKQNWRAALERASKSTFCKDGNWFDLEWFLTNDSNYEKCLNGKYDDPNGNSRAPAPPRLKEVQRATT